MDIVLSFSNYLVLSFCNCRTSNHPTRAAQVLHDSRPDVFRKNKTLSEMEFPQTEIGPPTFTEVFTWVYNHKVMDEHWNTIVHVCHPCAHTWGAILRIETMETDGQLLARLVNSSRPGVPVRHSHEQQPKHSQFGKELDLFNDMPDDVIEYFLEMYRADMLMFGYRWDSESRTAYCSIDTPDGPCC